MISGCKFQSRKGSNSASSFLPIPRRGLSRVEAAAYLGISPAKFDELRKDARVAPAKLIDGRKVWDIRALDEAFDALPDEIDQPPEDWQAAV